jgi:hypothetical protein
MPGRGLIACFVVAALGLSSPGVANAQGTSGPRDSDSDVGYIDPAIPGNILRFRYDDAFNSNRPTRDEFIYARSAPFGPGLPVPEPRIDYQELSAYVETAVTNRLSGFIDVPVRFLNPEVNPDHTGFSDLDAGAKYAFIYRPETVATFQFRTYVPTGKASEGLGTDHVSVEPALLCYNRLTDRMGLESELRLWVPIDGTSFAGEIIRYGIGAHYDVCHTCNLTLSPVVEFVGWTSLNGQESEVFPSGKAVALNAAGDTIVNAKLGLRVKFRDRADAYAGYGQALTGDRWYENDFRFEFRWFY